MPDPLYPRVVSSARAARRESDQHLKSHSNRPKTAPGQAPSIPASTSKQSTSFSTNILAGALIREYLNARGFKRTAGVFLQEDNEQGQSGLSNRQELAKQLGIIKWVRQNKSSEQPEKTYLEIIAKNLPTVLKSTHLSQDDLSPPKTRPTTAAERPRTAARGAAASTHTDISPTRDTHSASITAKYISRRPSLPDEDYPDPMDTFSYANPLRHVDASRIGNSSDDPSHATTAAFAKALGAFSSANPRSVMQDHVGPGLRASRELLVGGSGSPTGGIPGQSSRKSSRRSDERDSPTGFDTPHRPSTARPPSDASKPSPKPTPWTTHNPPRTASPRTPTQPRSSVSFLTHDLEVTDHLDDELTSDTNLSNILSGLSIGTSLGVGRGGTLITTQTALALRCLVFPGDRGRATFGEEWKNKGFEFCEREELRYGIVQQKGGPCGLLAAVQAFVLKHLLFTSHSFATQYLANARVSMSTMSRERYMPDGITENMELHEFSDQGSSREFLASNISQFMVNETGRHGVIQFLYSLILTRGIDTIKMEDMDEPDVRLIGRHGYCTQEMVNLILTGQAISNVFDGDVQLGGGDGDDDEGGNLLKGIKHPVQFGYLTLYEHYGSLKVGEYFKNPTYPIFIICSESHYTTLFSTDASLLSKTRAPPSSSSFQSHLRSPTPTGTQTIRSFDMYYYDGLANQTEEIRLSITLPNRPVGSAKGRAEEGEGLVPPLEHVIRTKWPGAVVDWNGSEPLL
ncbi:hypothetical protein HDV00_010260 [Rhizophlyctis rosea]|nr:hypothetical protein HDV00_010260 [Rhizophlyctis rosea]